jgi:glycosyltransferase involved in cell wall biosynthesis
MLNWKRVDLIIRAAYFLKSRHHAFTIDLIGVGPEKNRLIQMCHKLGMDNTINFLQPRSPEGVREAMRGAHVYLMPSNYREGWGAVVNEAMSEGCCVVASKGVGSAPWLIDNGKTGFRFESCNFNALCSVLESLLEDPEQCREIGINAWQCMKDYWSPTIAAERILMLANGLLGRNAMPVFEEGPCSPEQG